ncbi:MAG: alpha/beta fold hydrolase [Candidatus Nanohaloarchaea archaeon]
MHGWLESRKTWDHVREDLELDNPLVFYDLRCHGDSGCEEFDMMDLAADLHSLVKKLGFDSPVLVGRSLGGMTALKYVTMYDEWSGMLLFGTAASTPQPENESVVYFLQRFGHMDREEWSEKIVENYAGGEADDELKEQSKDLLMEADDRPVEYGLESMVHYDVRGKLRDFRKPVKVVAGKQDGAIPMEQSEQLAELLEADIEEIDTGHLMLERAPEKVAEIIDDFIEENF